MLRITHFIVILSVPVEKPREAGTKKNYRMHDIQLPAELRDSMPTFNDILYMYEIEMVPHFNTDQTQYDQHEENIKIFHKLLQSQRTYSILTKKKLPRLAAMKFFQSFGQIDCTVKHNATTIQIENAQQMNKLKRFHGTLFRNVLELWKSFFVFDPNNSVIVAPTKNAQIDWAIIDRFQSWEELETKTVAQRMNVEYREEDWLYSVVCPWYRADKNIRYIVTEVSSYQTPMTPFPNHNYSNYAEYAFQTYPDITTVVNMNQFLIGVKAMTQSLNRLHPGDGEDGRKAKNKTRGPEYLIPELCHNFYYPGDLWLKAIVLPSLLHRITYMLHAENIRLNINQYIGLDIVDYQPMPLREKMPINKVEYAKTGIHNAIIHPRADDFEGKCLTAEDIPRYDEEAVSSTILEPYDLMRNFDNAYEVDIDYYYHFISEKLSNMSIKNGGNNLFVPSQFTRNTPALCDVEKTDKMKIAILNTKLATPITRGIEQCDILAALTSASSSDVFHMELFEVLGDAFLKFSVSLYLIQNHPNWHEGYLTAIKGQIVGNRNLCYSAMRNNLAGKIKIHNFNPKEDWLPPMAKLDDLVKVRGENSIIFGRF